MTFSICLAEIYIFTNYLAPKLWHPNGFPWTIYIYMCVTPKHVITISLNDTSCGTTDGHQMATSLHIFVYTYMYIYFVVVVVWIKLCRWSFESGPCLRSNMRPHWLGAHYQTIPNASSTVCVGRLLHHTDWKFRCTRPSTEREGDLKELMWGLAFAKRQTIPIYCRSICVCVCPDGQRSRCGHNKLPVTHFIVHSMLRCGPTNSQPNRTTIHKHKTTSSTSYIPPKHTLHAL